MNITKIHSVLVQNVETIETEIKRLNKKVEKLGLSKIVYTVGLPYQQKTLRWKEVETTFGKELVSTEIIVTKKDVTISADEPESNGWTFAASITHAQDDKGITHNLIACANVKEIPQIPEKYRSVGSDCEHCNVKRIRNNTYILFNLSTNEFKQVGSSCLQDFLNCDLHKFASMKCWLDIIRIFSDDYFDEMGSGRPPNGEWLVKIIEVTQAYTNIFGFVSKKKVFESQNSELIATSTKVYDFISSSHFGGGNSKEVPWHVSETQKYGFIFNEKSKKKAQDVIDWFDTVSDEEIEKSDYMKNLKAIVCLSYIPFKFFGLACSLISCYFYAMEKIKKASEEKVNNANSQFVGTINKMSNFTFTCTKAIGPKCQLSFGYRQDPVYYGYFIMKDENGNIVKIKTGWDRIVKGKTYTIRCKPVEFIENDRYEQCKVTFMSQIRDVIEV